MLANQINSLVDVNTARIYVIDIAWKGVLYGLYSHEP